MQDLEPPEVPLELTSQLPVIVPEKKGFFKKLFSKKTESANSGVDLSSSANIDSNAEQSNADLPKIDLPELELPSSLDVANLDNVNITAPETAAQDSGNNLVLPSIEEQISFSSAAAIKAKGKSRGKLKKGQARKIDSKDESSQFDWNREITDQEILIHDSNRFNQDVNTLITTTDDYIEDKTSKISDNVLASQHEDTVHDLESLNVNTLGQLTRPMEESSTNETPVVDEDMHKLFTKISVGHGRLKSTLEKYLHNKKLFNNNKEKIASLFEQYDENVEKIIEDKELELTKKKQHLNKFESHLKTQESEIKQVHNYISKLDIKLKERESTINEIISKSVEKELTRRIKIEQKALREELKKTVILNNDLKKKVKIIESDRERFNIEHQKMSEMERKKLTELQLMYEKKLKELDLEKKGFEEERNMFFARRKAALDLIKKADSISNELKKVKQMQSYVDSGKKLVEKELNDDKELKHAIAQAEIALVQEKDNLDNMVFDKYINNKLKNIKPEYLEKKQDWKAALKSNPIYDEVSQCRSLLSEHKLADAKAMYNAIRKEYERLEVSITEKEAIYNTIRELYNEIQLKLVEIQMRSR